MATIRQAIRDTISATHATLTREARQEHERGAEALRLAYLAAREALLERTRVATREADQWKAARLADVDRMPPGAPGRALRHASCGGVIGYVYQDPGALGCVRLLAPDGRRVPYSWQLDHCPQCGATDPDWAVLPAPALEALEAL